MNVLVDLLFIVPGRNRGVRTYVDNLLAEMNDLSDVNVTGLTNRRNHDHYRNALGLRCHAAPVGGGNRLTRILYQQAGIGLVARSTKADVLFCPGYLSPIFPSLPTVVTVHDMGFEDVPGSAPRMVRSIQRLVIPGGIRFASRIITVSQFSKSRIMDVLGVSGDKITVIHSGPLASGDAFVESGWPALRRKHGILGEFFLSISEETASPVSFRLCTKGSVCPRWRRSRAACRSRHRGTAAFRKYVVKGRFMSTRRRSTSVEDIAAALIELCRNAVLRERLVRKGYENVRRFSRRRAAVATAAVLENAARGEPKRRRHG